MDKLIKMVYYELINVTITAPALAEIIIEAIVQYYSLLDLIVSDFSLVFTSKFGFS